MSGSAKSLWPKKDGGPQAFYPGGCSPGHSHLLLRPWGALSVRRGICRDLPVPLVSWMAKRRVVCTAGCLLMSLSVGKEKWHVWVHLLWLLKTQASEKRVNYLLAVVTGDIFRKKYHVTANQNWTPEKWFYWWSTTWVFSFLLTKFSVPLSWDRPWMRET